jgi:hypothetical protein
MTNKLVYILQIFMEAPNIGFWRAEEIEMVRQCALSADAKSGVWKVVMLHKESKRQDNIDMNHY